jgi:hypothetical protein
VSGDDACAIMSRLFLPIFRGCGRLERAEKPTRYPGDVVDCRIESGLVRLGWFVEAADLDDLPFLLMDMYLTLPCGIEDG